MFLYIGTKYTLFNLLFICFRGAFENKSEYPLHLTIQIFESKYYLAQSRFFFFFFQTKQTMFLHSFLRASSQADMVPQVSIIWNYGAQVLTMLPTLSQHLSQLALSLY